MDVLVIISLGLVFLLILITFFFFLKQRKIKKKHILHRSKSIPKYELLETSDDSLYYEYYEPKIIDVLPLEEGAE